MRLLCPWGFSRQEYQSRLPCPPMGDLPNRGIEPRSCALQADSLLSEPPGKPAVLSNIKWEKMGFLGDTSGKECTCQCGRHRDTGSIPGLGRSPGGGYGNPLQYSCLENPMDRRALWSTVYRVAESRTQLKQWSTHTAEKRCMCVYVQMYIKDKYIYLFIYCTHKPVNLKGNQPWIFIGRNNA